MIIIQKRAAAAGLTYLYELDFTSATNQDFNDGDTLDTTAEGAITGTCDCKIIDGDMDIVSGVFEITGQTTYTVNDLALYGQTSMTVSPGVCCRVDYSGSPGQHWQGWEQVNTHPYVNTPSVWNNASYWIPGVTQMSCKTKTGSDTSILLIVGGCDAANTGDYYIGGVDTLSNFTYGVMFLLKDNQRTSWQLMSVSNTYNLTSSDYYNMTVHQDVDIKKLKIPDSHNFFTEVGTNLYVNVSRWSGNNGDLISSEYTPDVGSDWPNDNFDIVPGGGAVHCNSASDSIITHNAEPIIVTKIKTPASGTTPYGLIYRHSDSSNYWYAKVTPGTGVELLEINAGSPTSRGSMTPTLSTSTTYLMTVNASGTDHHRVNLNGFINSGGSSFNSTATGSGFKDEGTSNAEFGPMYLFAHTSSAFDAFVDAIT